MHFFLLQLLIVAANLSLASSCRLCTPRVLLPFSSVTSATHAHPDNRPFEIRPKAFVLKNNPTDDDDVSNADTPIPAPATSPDPDNPFINAVQGYKDFISPVLPKACRFQPTCSTYSIDAIKKFGNTKGLILTAWRIARCNPFGGRGYDPPVWPPVDFNFGSY